MTERAVRIALLVAVVLSLVLAPAAVAAKGGGGGGGGGGSTAATLTVSPTSVAAGDSFSAWGCGYATGKQVNVVVTTATYQQFWPIGVDASGCVTFGGWTGAPGEYTVATYQQLKGRQQTLMASATLWAY